MNRGSAYLIQRIPEFVLLVGPDAARKGGDAKTGYQHDCE